MHFIRAAAYLPSAFLWVLFAIALPLWLYIYLFIFFSFAISCLANPFLRLLSFLFHRSNWVIFSLFARKNIRCYMRSHYPLRRYHISEPYIYSFFISSLQIVYVDCAAGVFRCAGENYSYISMCFIVQLPHHRLWNNKKTGENKYNVLILRMKRCVNISSNVKFYAIPTILCIRTYIQVHTLVMVVESLIVLQLCNVSSADWCKQKKDKRFVH